MIGVVGCSGLAGVIIFFSSLDIASRGGTTSDVLPYLASFIPLAYSIILLYKILKNKEFDKNHKNTLHLLIWPSFITLIISIFLTVITITSKEMMGVFFVVVVLLVGTSIASVLSFVGLIIDSIQNKKHLN